MVVDSAPIIYLLDGHPDFAPRFEGLFEAYEAGLLEIALSTITVAEVLAGPLRSGDAVLMRRYEKTLSEFEIAPVSMAIAVTAARLRASAGLRLPDALQAATALECQAAALVTHDRDFARLTGMRVLTGAESL
ncbi:MAG: type II toxin-antitoxin system VapC family toxin [Lautropia sp.]